MKRALIVTGGRMESSFGLAYMDGKQFDYAAAVDFGLHFFYEAKLKPDMAVGDFDSAGRDALAFFEGQEGIEWVRLNPMKDDTDTEAALRQMLEKGCQEIHILGGTGSRLDHVLGNIGLLELGLKAGSNILLADPCNRIRMINDRLSIKKEEQYGKYVSLIPVTAKAAGVTLSGMKYPLSDAVLFRGSTLGISNEIAEDEAVILVREGTLLVAESKD